MQVDDDGLSLLADGCKNLKKLNLCYCIQISNQGLQSLSYLEGLSDLELRGLVNVTSVGITSIAFGCKSLVELDLKGCSSIDDAALFALAHSSHNLRQVIRLPSSSFYSYVINIYIHTYIHIHTHISIL